MPYDATPLSTLSLSELAEICRQDDHPDCEAARDEYDARRSAQEAAYEKRAETFGTKEWARRYDAERAALADWRGWNRS